MIKSFGVLTNLLCENAQAEVGPSSLAWALHAFDPKIHTRVLSNEVDLIKRSGALLPWNEPR